MQDYRAHNHALLMQDDPALLEELAGIDTDHLTPRPARKGGLTLQLGDLPVHSPYDPAKEAAKLVTGTPAAAHIHLGLGLGHLLAADAAADDGTVLVFEPIPLLAAAALRFTPLADQLRAKRARLCCSLPRFKELLGEVLKGDRPYRLHVLPFHARALPRLPTEVEALCRTTHVQSGIALRTLERNAAYLTHGALVGLRHTTRLPGVAQLAGLFEGVPAVVVSAGPSLDQNLRDLVPYADRCLIIAIARTARPLERLGLRPHVLVHNEPKPYYHFIEGCTNLADTAFVLSLQAEPPYYRAPHGPTFVFQNPANFTGRWLAERYPHLGKAPLESGGSVSTEAFSLALLMGCSPVILLGQDLALKEGRYYATSETNQNFSHGHGDLLRVPGYFGETVTSLSTYYSYADWFGEAAARARAAAPTRVLVNATEGGVALRGFTHMKLRHAAAQFCLQPIAPRDRFARAAQVPPEACLSPEELAELWDGCGKTLDALDALCDAFNRLGPRLSALLPPTPASLPRLQQLLPRFEEMKDTYRRLNTDFFVLSGFMQAELIAAARARRADPAPAAGADAASLGRALQWEVDDFARTLRATAAGVARMRAALLDAAAEDVPVHPRTC